MAWDEAAPSVRFNSEPESTERRPSETTKTPPFVLFSELQRSGLISHSTWGINQTVLQIITYPNQAPLCVNVHTAFVRETMDPVIEAFSGNFIAAKNSHGMILSVDDSNEGDAVDHIGCLFFI